MTWAARPIGESPARRGAQALRRALGFDLMTLALGITVAAAGPLVASIACQGAGVLPLAAAILIPTPLLLTISALYPRRTWTALEVLMWNNLYADDDWRRNTGLKCPRRLRQAKAWLDRHPEGSVPLRFTTAVQLIAGNMEIARQCIERLSTDTAEQRHWRLDLDIALRLAGGQSIDAEVASADHEARAQVGIRPDVLALHLARHAHFLAQSRGADGIAEIATALPGLGPMTPRWALQVVIGRFGLALASLFIGVWILVAMALSGAAAGGVFWL